MNAEVISIGDELLIGQVLNSNQAVIAEKLNSVGIFVDWMTTVGDDREKILEAFRTAVDRSDVVSVTGGLGPTHDDITREAVCTFFNSDLIQDAAALENVKQIFSRRGLPLLKLNEEQALVPRGCTVIQNSNGTAPGYFFEKAGKYFIAMPGVPSEMEGMMDGFVLPYFAKRGTGLVIRHRTLKTTGIAESILANSIGDVRYILPTDGTLTLAYLPSITGVRLRLTARSASIQEAETRLNEAEQKLRSKAKAYIYGTDDEELEQVVGTLLRERKMTLAIVESCTGGLIADRITDVPGSSEYFERSVTTYSNASKLSELGVPSEYIESHGAVSREVAEAMAFGIRTKSNCDIGLSTTGIAGPSGGTPEKPVGLVWIGYSDRRETIALRFNFPIRRRQVKERAAQAALELLRRKLLKLAERG